MDFETEGGDVTIQVSQFRNPVLKVILNGKEQRYIAYSPYQLSLKAVEKGTHKLEIIAFGNRVNIFGPIHNCNETQEWIGPNAWRTEGTSWAST